MGDNMTYDKTNNSHNHADRSERKAKTVVSCIAILLGITAVIACVNAMPKLLTNLIKLMG